MEYYQLQRQSNFK